MAKDINVKITGDSRDLERALGSASKKASGFGRTLGRAAKIGGAALAAGLGAGAIASVKAASDLEESMNAIQVVFGEATGAIKEFGETSAESVGLSQRAFNQAVTPIGAALRNVGLGAQEAANQSINLTQRAADMASVFNTDVSEALTAIQAALRGEADPIERFGIGLSDAAVQAEAARLGMKKLDGQFSQGQKVRARLSLFFKQSNRFAGDFANTSGGLANQTRILRARLEDMAAQIGAKLLPVLADAAERANDFLTFLQKVGKQKTIEAKVRVVWEGVSGAARDLMQQLNKLLFGSTSVKRIALPTGRLIEIEETRNEGLVSQIGRALENADWSEIGAKIGKGISTSIKFTRDMLNRFAEFIDQNLGQLADIGAKLALAVVATLMDPAFWARNWKLVAVVAVSAIPGGAFARLGGRIGALLVRPLLRVVPAGFRAAAAQAIKALQPIIGFISGVFRRTLGRIPGWVAAAFKFSAVVTAVNAVQRAATAIKNAIRNAVNFIRDQWNKLPGIIRSAAGAFTPIISAVRTVIGWVERLASAIRNLPSLPSRPSLNPLDYFPGRAMGGPVSAGRAYMVGERGPEMFVPSTSGRVVANGAGGSQVINLNVDGHRLASIVRLHDGRYAQRNG